MPLRNLSRKEPEFVTAAATSASGTYSSMFPANGHPSVGYYSSLAEPNSMQMSISYLSGGLSTGQYASGPSVSFSPSVGGPGGMSMISDTGMFGDALMLTSLTC